MTTVGKPVDMEDAVIEVQFEVFGREITFWLYAKWYGILNVHFYRKRILMPLPKLGFAGKKINMAHAGMNIPIGGMGIEIWKF